MTRAQWVMAGLILFWVAFLAFVIWWLSRTPGDDAIGDRLAEFDRERSKRSGQ